MMATKPATAPRSDASTPRFPLTVHSMNIQASAARRAVAICVTAIAYRAAIGGPRGTGIEPEPADPQKRGAGQRHTGYGRHGFFVESTRCRAPARKRARRFAELMCTTVPASEVEHACRAPQPPGSHIQCAMGA